MSRRAILLGLFAVLSLVQLAVPLSMIVRREFVLLSGKVYKFKTAPMDPVDALRGRYVALSFAEREVEVDDPGAYVAGARSYALLSVDADGFARVSGLRRDEPRGADFLVVQAYPGSSDNRVRVELPFDRFYMEEDLAPAAEQAYWEHSRRGQQDAYVTVRVRGDQAVLEELWIGGKPIGEYLREARAPGH